eukprot:TRINITY_DN26865_c1_g2_i2.p1 TRINITY_DN26865_c1_g2~~TRINITY_DN26865_c1_g2_i2.p1  ORF type:complete len:326 (+),score=50.85 TRINITY_DN26865_c1_g2_i2:601-1578(+)
MRTPPRDGGGVGGTRPSPLDGGGDGRNPPQPSHGSDCSAPPWKASLLGYIGVTTVAGRDARTGTDLPVGENISGPFEAGFGTAQDTILAQLGCSPGSLGHVDGGIDTNTAEQMVAHQCSVALPRVEGDRYVGLLDECERLACLYNESGQHSTQVGRMNDEQFLYGKWENFSTSLLPELDACGGHFGPTPDSAGATVYHYHLKVTPPCTVACFGPAIDDDGTRRPVTLAECRAVNDGCDDGDEVTIATPSGSRQYDPWCPCFDDLGSNVGLARGATVDGRSPVLSASTNLTSTFAFLTSSGYASTGVAIISIMVSSVAAARYVATA